MVPNRIPGHRHDIEVGGVVGFESRHLDERETIDSVEVAADLLGQGQGFSALDPADDFQQIGTPDLEHRALAQDGQDILAEDAQDGRMCALPAGLDAQRVTFEPGVEHGLERMLAG